MSTSLGGALPGRKAEALAFIETFLITKGHSPTIDEIAAALGVSKTRMKELVRQLARDGAIVRAPGAQRGISVPGLTRRMEIEHAKALLRASGHKIDEDFLPEDERTPCPKGHLPIVAVIAHIARPDSGKMRDGEGDDTGHKRRRPRGARAAARRAPGAGAAAPEDEGGRAA